MLFLLERKPPFLAIPNLSTRALTPSFLISSISGIVKSVGTFIVIFRLSRICGDKKRLSKGGCMPYAPTEKEFARLY